MSGTFHTPENNNENCLTNITVTMKYWYLEIIIKYLEVSIHFDNLWLTDAESYSFAKSHFEMVTSCVTLKGQCYLIRVNKLNTSTQYAKNKGYNNYFPLEGP